MLANKLGHYQLESSNQEAGQQAIRRSRPGCLFFNSEVSQKHIAVLEIKKLVQVPFHSSGVDDSVAESAPLDLVKLTHKVSEYQHLQQLLKSKLKIVLNKNSDSLIKGMQRV